MDIPIAHDLNWGHPLHIHFSALDRSNVVPKIRKSDHYIMHFLIITKTVNWQ